MSYKLYTTYNHKIKDIPNDCSIAIIMRFPFFISDPEKIAHTPGLSPVTKTLADFKKDKDWNKFESRFKEQMYSDKETMESINLLMEALEHNPVCLVCCEKSNEHCHRRLIAEYLESLGYKWEEL